LFLAFVEDTVSSRVIGYGAQFHSVYSANVHSANLFKILLHLAYFLKVHSRTVSNVYSVLGKCAQFHLRFGEDIRIIL
jgi:hypothetical protein